MTHVISWTSQGIKSVSLVASGDRTLVGGRSRGRFTLNVADAVPAERGKVEWRVPWVDAASFTLKMTGYDASGRAAAADFRVYEFRPATLENRTADGIYVDLHRRYHQRLYVQRGGHIVKVYLTTSSEGYEFRARDDHPDHPHDHAGVFQVLEKEPDHWSREFHVPMLWAMRYNGGHFIHATTSQFYARLGEASSHGCNRLTRHDARELYDDTPVGTRLEVIGPTR